MITRFAPSPTGFLHRGHAFSAWMARCLAPSGFRLRLEDIDQARCRPAYAEAILEDLAWLGLDWAGEVRVQSRHFDEYAAALGRLERFLYPCFCSRADIAQHHHHQHHHQYLGAPHGPVAAYPGTCRGLTATARAARLATGAPYALRLDATAAQRQTGALKYFELSTGWVAVPPASIDDVVLARRDIPASYHLCVTHDDALQGVTHVVRGEDLRAATPVHVLLQKLLGYDTPVYAHHRLLRGADGRRLAKRDGAASIREMRQAGDHPAAILAGFEELA